MIYAFIIASFTIGYIALILIYLKVWKAVPKFDFHNITQTPFITVIIPARNEAKNISRAIHSLKAQSYPSDYFEIIIVDDHSEDSTVKVVESFLCKGTILLKLGEINIKKGEVAYKKRSIEEAVKISKGEIIITTDADCQHHPDWLATIAAAFESKNANMISGAVLFNFDKSRFQQFQALDFLGMIGITAASIHLGMFNLANGANLAFRKSVFDAVDGYKGIDKKASGDDMLLIYKFAQINPQKVLFLKSETAVVYTDPANNLTEFVHQRLRWTSKSFSYQDSRITWILAFVYLVNLLLVGTFILGFIFKSPFYFSICFSQFALMSLVDFIFLKNVSTFFNRQSLLKTFFTSQLFHVFYIIIIGLLGNVIQYKWKGRKLE